MEANEILFQVHTTARPWSAELLRSALRLQAERNSRVELASQKQCGLVAGKLNELLGGKAKRIEFMSYVFDVTSTKDLTVGQASALLAWLIKEDGSYDFKPWASKEAELVIRAGAVERGQMEMF